MLTETGGRKGECNFYRQTQGLKYCQYSTSINRYLRVMINTKVNFKKDLDYAREKAEKASFS